MFDGNVQRYVCRFSARFYPSLNTERSFQTVLSILRKDVRPLFLSEKVSSMNYSFYGTQYLF